MNKIKPFLFVIIISMMTNSSAQEIDTYLNNLNYCSISETKTNDYEPETFETTNNLLKKPGQLELYCGEKIIIHGRVLDQNCVPISDAKVYVWQANCSGKYPYQPLKNVIDEDLIAIDNGITFTGNGTATTNNKGEFNFITVYPAAVHDMDSHINIRVEHHRLGFLQTILSLRGKKVNNPQNHPDLNSISDIADMDGTSIYDFKIVLPGSALKSY